LADLEISGLHKLYCKVQALNGIELTCPDGAYVCLLGPSGCGKSTLLRIIAGLEPFQEGRILVGGRRIDHLGPGERHMGLAFQNYALYPHLTVRGNLAFPLRAPRHKHLFSETEIARRVASTASLLHLDALLDKPVTALSGGQKQRVALGRALIKEPELLLLDEPITHLDARLRHEMRSELKLLHQRLGTTTIHVTHDQLEAMAIADQLVVMNRGRVEQVASPRQLYANPRTTFVAGFVGDPPMSLLAGRVEFDAGPRFIAGPLELPLPAHLQALGSTLESRDVVVGIRSEAVRPSIADGAIAGHVKSHGWVGRQQQIVVELGPNQVRFRTDATTRIHVGDPIGLEVNLDDAKMFSGTTGRAY
jgi:multiple sugar transport system ATP-binding protein